MMCEYTAYSSDFRPLSSETCQKVLPHSVSDVVDQNIEAASLLAPNARHKPLDVTFLGLIAANRDSFAAASGDHLGGFVDRFAAALGDELAGDAASGAVGGSGFAQRTGNAASGATSGSGDESDAAGEGLGLSGGYDSGFISCGQSLLSS